MIAVRSIASLLTVVVALAPAPAAAQDAVPILELTDADLAAIDLDDGAVLDWRSVLGSPTLTAADFRPIFNARVDPADLDFAVWLAWHDATDRIYCAVERVDDVYLNRFGTQSLRRWFDMFYQDSCVLLSIDGDASGGDFQPIGSGYSEEERRAIANVHAQSWLAVADTHDDGRRVELYENGVGYTQHWFVEPPHAAGGDGSFSEAPIVSVTEFYVTPFGWSGTTRRPPSSPTCAPTAASPCT